MFPVGALCNDVRQLAHAQVNKTGQFVYAKPMPGLGSSVTVRVGFKCNCKSWVQV